MTDLPLWLTPAQTAELLQISLPTLARWRRAGTGPNWEKMGRAVRYNRASLNAWTNGTPEMLDYGQAVSLYCDVVQHQPGWTQPSEVESYYKNRTWFLCSGEILARVTSRGKVMSADGTTPLEEVL